MIFIDACFKKPTKHTPVWLMRQAGRYLSEYKATRAKAKDFIEFYKNPELACEATLQPIDILGVDAAILFSDILTIPAEMGLNLEFIEKRGPVFHTTARSESEIDALSNHAADNTGYVYDAISLIRKNLAPDIALIGFAGSPWTLATYMIEGGSSKTFDITKKMLYSEPATLHKLLSKLTTAVTVYLLRQIEAGANAVQVFDSWGGALEKSAFFEFSWGYMKQISAAVKAKHPDVPIILFSKGVGSYLDGIDGEFDVFGVDWGTPMQLAKNAIFDRYALQGNLEPCRLYSRVATEEGAKAIMECFKNEPGHIFNLGHGMLPDLPRENAKFLVDFVHSYN